MDYRHSHQPLINFPKADRLVISEEKYPSHQTTLRLPQDNRGKPRNPTSIAHLKIGDNTVNTSKFSKEAEVTTAEGKHLISNFLAANIDKIHLKKEITVDIDSELHKGGCACNKDNEGCKCDTFAVPIRCHFNKDGFVSSEVMLGIKQCKGEAELAQVDWLLSASQNLCEKKAVASFVSSGDIDSVIVHLFAISLHWPRDNQGQFLHPVYVVLQKRGKLFDFYDITGIIEVLEKKFENKYVGIKVAIGLCMGGNDFVPKFHSMAHKKVLQLALSDVFLHRLITINPPMVTLNEGLYPEFVKHLYAGNKADCCFEDVRKKTMMSGPMLQEHHMYRNPQLWMPPHSALVKVAKIVTLQIEYYLTVGTADAKLPPFLLSGCFSKTLDGSIEYNFGEDAFAPLVPFERQSTKRKSIERTPRKDRASKKPLTSTPKKTKAKSQRKLLEAIGGLDLP